MRRLIYQIAFGDNCRELCRMSVKSLRSAGQYAGDVIVFSDKDFRVDAKVVVVPPETDWQRQCSARMTLGLTLPLDDYDAILYADTDVLFLADVSPLFEDMQFMRAMSEPHAMGYHHPANGHLTVEEQRDAKLNAINAGVVAGGREAFRAALRVWLEVYQTPVANTHFRDQSSLNAAVYRGLIPFKHYPREVVAPFEWVRDARTRFQQLERAMLPVPALHFWGTTKEWMPEAMTRLAARGYA